MADGPTAEGPSRRRSSWSLKTIVEDVAGKPITDFQDPDRPVHPYLKAKMTPPTDGTAEVGPEPYDPVGHLYPPLVGAPGRAYHGPDHEHHPETLERHRPEPTGPGEQPRVPGPVSRPERLYLHYLLLHMDRLSDTALRYLRSSVEEEVAHRARTPPRAGPPSPDAKAAKETTATPAAPAAASGRDPAPEPIAPTP